MTSKKHKTTRNRQQINRGTQNEAQNVCKDNYKEAHNNCDETQIDY